MTAFLKLLFRNRLAAMGAVVLSVIVLLALLTPILPLQERVQVARWESSRQRVKAGIDEVRTDLVPGHGHATGP